MTSFVAERSPSVLDDSPARYDATERLRELSQEVFDIGDEVATYIDNISEAVADWDKDLVTDCLAELDVIVDEAREDIRTAVPELEGIRRALTSGIRSGFLSAGPGARTRAGKPPAGLRQQPKRMTAESLAAAHPLPTVVAAAGVVGEVLNDRTAAVSAYCSDVAEWVIDRTDLAMEDLSSTNLSIVFARAHQSVILAVEAWIDTVAQPYAPYTRMMRGSCPPPFLAERARIDRIVANVASRRKDGHFAS